MKKFVTESNKYTWAPNFMFTEYKRKRGVTEDDDMELQVPEQNIPLAVIRLSNIEDVTKTPEILQKILLDGKFTPDDYVNLVRALPRIGPSMKKLVNGGGLYEGRRLWRELSAYYFPSVNVLPRELQDKLSNNYFRKAGTESAQEERAWSLFYIRAWFWRKSIRVRVVDVACGGACDFPLEKSEKNNSIYFEHDEARFERFPKIFIDNREADELNQGVNLNYETLCNDRNDDEDIRVTLFLEAEKADGSVAQITLVKFNSSFDSSIDGDQFTYTSLYTENLRDYADVPEFLGGELYKNCYVEKEELRKNIKKLKEGAEADPPEFYFDYHIGVVTNWSRLTPQEAEAIHNRCSRYACASRKYWADIVD